MHIYPAILTSDIAEAQQQLDSLAEELGGEISRVHIDIIDGIFADEKTLTPADVPLLDFHTFELDLHLMTEEPIEYVHELEDFAPNAPVRTVIGQIEKMHSPLDFVTEVHRLGKKASLSLDIFTDLRELDDAILQQLDGLQLMAVEAGAQGQEFHPIVLERIDTISHRLKTLGIRDSFELLIDGGITTHTITAIAQHKIEAVAVGSYLWRAADLPAAFHALKKG